MARASIPVDLGNPGQVFACLGLMEAAEILLGGAEGGFDWSGADTRFHLSAAGERNPVAAVLEFLAEARAEADAPSGSDLAAKEAGVPTSEMPQGLFPCPLPNTPSALPCRLLSPDGTRAVPITHWVDRSVVGLDSVKFWAGMAGYSGTALVRDMLDQIRPLDGNRLAAAVADPFGTKDPLPVSAPQTSNLRLDYRGGNIPFDAGFAPNAHSGYVMTGFPLVEVLAAIGLENARPERPDPRDKLVYRYAAWGRSVPPSLARPLLGAADLGIPTRIFRMCLDWPGQENQARAITSVREEPVR
ncbi:type I-G CRISPR-associated protein Cas8g2 [Oharaeibacter diazotrophicus]|uniref:CRISPR-associated protein Csx14 n=1 Tax=Oharaeibacter diazotrophicus TaxID=1920512 RepID=A0A4R6RHU7_9HYPH|nr:type I-U CRISPR-associated protein Cas8c [Oharaeibacter diazotrophicus]TDP85417.1 CRISPR-associated protein Csx14 [Oharaeibacter diazotrophicus]BBE74387.1 hypothetical protein OHA_1_04018 [Pleomorphomonas sp. SM30]GLS75918.1 hypothetical protein GCM10007904_12530 [Oharaeibacter diazotrophicus]